MKELFLFAFALARRQACAQGTNKSLVLPNMMSQSNQPFRLLKIFAAAMLLCLFGEANARDTYSSNVTVYEYKSGSPAGSKILFDVMPCSMNIYADARERTFWIVDEGMRMVGSGCYTVDTVESDVLIYKQNGSKIAKTLSIHDESKAGNLVAINNFYEKYHWNPNHTALLNGGEKPQQEWYSAGIFEDKTGRINLFSSKGQLCKNADMPRGGNIGLFDKPGIDSICWGTDGDKVIMVRVKDGQVSSMPKSAFRWNENSRPLEK